MVIARAAFDITRTTKGIIKTKKPVVTFPEICRRFLNSAILEKTPVPKADNNLGTEAFQVKMEIPQ
jgi:hypothetical protein